MVPVGAVVSVGAPEVSEDDAVEMKGSGDWQPFDRPRSRLWHDVINREFAVGALRSNAGWRDRIVCCHCSPDLFVCRV